MPNSRLSALALSAFAAFAASCDQKEGDDLDQDGFSVADGDCDDFNDTVYPGAPESGNDDLDTNCDGSNTPGAGDEVSEQAFPLLDTNSDGEISLEEFAVACADGAMVFGEANPGVVETHVACGGSSSCRGMILHPWGELYEHDCKGANGCAGWSCVETADDQGRDGETLFREGTCNYCHSGDNGTFRVQVPEGEDAESWIATFFDRSDDEFRSTVAFGAMGVDADGVAWRDMPGFYRNLSRAEMDTVIAYIRTMELEPPLEEEE